MTEDEQTVDTPTWERARVGTVEARVKRVKNVGKEEEASEGASNDGVVVSLSRSVGGHTRVGASKSDSLEQKKEILWRETAVVSA